MKHKNKRFDDILNEKLQDSKFKEHYDEAYLRMSLAIEFTKRRKDLGISQTELAKRIHTKQNNISRFEAAKVNPSLDTLQRMAKALGLKLKIELEA